MKLSISDNFLCFFIMFLLSFTSDNSTASAGLLKEGQAWSMDSDAFVHLANGPMGDDPDADDNWIEAAYLHKRGEYYYLFANWYGCCRGPESTYVIVVGRSPTLGGPFLDKEVSVFFISRIRFCVIAFSFGDQSSVIEAVVLVTLVKITFARFGTAGIVENCLLSTSLTPDSFMATSRNWYLHPGDKPFTFVDN